MMVQSATRIQAVARARRDRRAVAALRRGRRDIRACRAPPLGLAPEKRPGDSVPDSVGCPAARAARSVRAAPRQEAERCAIKVQAQHPEGGRGREQGSARRHALRALCGAFQAPRGARGAQGAARRALEESSATAVQRAARGRMARRRVARERARVRARRVEECRARRKKWSGLNPSIKSPYRALLTYKGIKGRRGRGGIGLAPRRVRQGGGGGGPSGAGAVLLGGPSLLRGEDSSTPLIALDPVDAEAAREIDVMAGEAGKEIMMLAQSSVESLMRAADGPGSGSGSAADSCRRRRKRRTRRRPFVWRGGGICGNGDGGVGAAPPSRGDAPSMTLSRRGLALK